MLKHCYKLVFLLMQFEKKKLYKKKQNKTQRIKSSPDCIAEKRLKKLR